MFGRRHGGDVADDNESGAGIAAGGIPCGVLTLVAADRDRPMPTDFTLDDLRRAGTTLSWDDASARLVWDDRDFGAYPLVLDTPPPAETATRIRTGRLG